MRMRPARVVPTAQRHKAAGERKVADAGVVDRLPWQCRQWIGGIRRASTGLALWRRQGVVAGQGVTVLLVCVLRRLLRAAQICIGWTAVSVPLSANGSWRTSRRLSGFFGEGIKDIEGGAPRAVRDVGCFGPGSPDGQGDRKDCCVRIHRTAQVLTQSTNSDSAPFHTESAGLLLFVPCGRMLCEGWVVCRVVTGNPGFPGNPSLAPLPFLSQCTVYRGGAARSRPSDGSCLLLCLVRRETQLRKPAKPDY